MYSVVLLAALSGGSHSPSWLFTGHPAPYPYNVSTTCTGCYGGSYYGAPYCACTGCYGLCWGGDGGSFGCYGGRWGTGLDYNCFGCHGCYGCYASFSCGGYNPYGIQATVPEVVPPPKVDENKGGSGSSSVAPDRARVIVQVPADAKLYFDDQPIKAGRENQSFSTPRLERGQAYYYDVRAEAVRDGQTVVERKRLVVRAGQQVGVTFPKLDTPPSGIAAADAKFGR
ncbi:MAG TPA: TIGR03000 domain-containing protein [Gemmataceae bacterium]|nr:TIGR03000 domain-containing protein [Gemmataceae bacterium]